MDSRGVGHHRDRLDFRIPRDFVVANDDQHKAIARERYRQYRGLGIELTTQNLATHPLNLA